MTQHPSNDLRRVRQLEHDFYNHMTLFGYELLSIPIIQPAEIFLTRASDKIIERLFTFERHGTLLALRPEFTAAASYRYVSEQRNEPVRWQFAGAIFEDEPSDYSLQYQKQSIGAEYLGVPDVTADAEIIAMAVQGVQKQGIEDWRLVLSDVGLQMHLLAQFELDMQTMRSLLSDKETEETIASSGVQQESKSSPTSINANQTQVMLDVLLNSARGNTMGGRTRQDIAQRLIDKQQRRVNQQEITEAREFLKQWQQIPSQPDQAFDAIQAQISPEDSRGQAMLAQWQELLNLLEAYHLPKDRIRIQTDFSRDWEYYTGTVFGVQTTTGEFLAGGGRYDGLTRLLGSEYAVPAVGFAYYVETILNQLGTRALSHSITVGKEDPISETVLLEWAQALREKGIAVKVQEQGAILVKQLGAQYGEKTYSMDDLDSLIQAIKTTE